ncbi:MAG: CvpA family protein [Burkholderia sp.]|nr:CvpA family protein [Burkholderia sp.]
MLTIFDYTVLVVIALSSLRGAWLGFTSEVFYLIGWIIGFIVANRYSLILMPYIPADWPGGILTQWGISFFLIVIGVLFIIRVSSAMLYQIVQITGFVGIDRCLGMIFGMIRGVLLVIILVIAAGFTELPRQSFWHNALLLPYVDRGVNVLKNFLPDDIVQYIHT